MILIKAKDILKLIIKKFNTGGVRRKWLMFLFLILIIPVIFGMFICGYMREKMESDKITSSLVAVTGIRQSVDNVLSWNEKFCRDIMLEEKIADFGKWIGTPSMQQRFELQQLANELTREMPVNEAVTDMYIYFGKMDTIVSTASCIESEIYYNAHFSDAFSDYESWKGLIQTKENIFFKSEKGNRLFYARSWPQAYVDGVHVVTEFDTSRFNVDFENLNITDRGRMLFIFNGEAVYSKGNTEIPVPKEFLEGADKKVREVKYNGKTYKIFEEKTNIKKARIIYAVEKNDLFHDIKMVNVYTYFAYAIIILLGIGLVIMIFRRIYRPVDELLEVVGADSALDDDEFVHIKNYIKSEKVKKELLIKVSQEQMTTINEQRLMEFLSGDCTSDPGETVSAHGIDAKSKHFNVICFALSAGNREKFYENYNETVSEIKTKLFGVLSGIECKFLQIDRKRYTVVLVSSDAIIQKELKSRLKHLCDAVYDRHGFKPVIILSRHCDDIYDLPVEYKKASSLIKNADIGEGVILMESEIFDDLNVRYSFSVDYKKQMDGFLKQGMADEAIDLVEKIFRKSFGEEGNYNVRLAEFFIFQIASILVKFIEQSENEELKVNAVNIINMIYDDSSIDEMKTTLIKYIQILCDGVIKNETETKDELISNIIEIVRAEYGNDLLNVSMIADKLQMYQNYISTVFKKRVGKGLLEYINEYRMEKAADLLLNTDMTVDAIAGAVGCNTRTFYRNFLKFYGVTATNYRKKQR